MTIRLTMCSSARWRWTPSHWWTGWCSLLLNLIGARWEHGSLGLSNEHLASVSIRRFLERILETIGLPGQAPVLVCATPKGQHHELGALLSPVAAAGMGWRPVFPGPDLPAQEIAGAARQLRATAVALSAIYPESALEPAAEITRLASLLAEDTALLLGAAAAHAHRDAVVPRAILVSDFAELSDHLRQITAGEPVQVARPH